MPAKPIVKKYEIYIWTPLTAIDESIAGTPSVVEDFKLVTGPIIMAETEATIVLLTPKYKKEGSIVLAVKTGSKPWHLGSKSNVSGNAVEGYTWNLVESLYVAYQKTVKGSQFYKSVDDVPFSVKKSVSPAYKPKPPKYNAYGEPFESSYSPPPGVYTGMYSPTPTQANLTGKWVKCKLSCGSFPAKSQKIKGLSTMSYEVQKVVNLDTFKSGLVVTEDKECKEEHKHDNGYQNDFWGRLDDKELVEFMVEKGFFVRPCPQNPKHGFVDSRVVKAAEEARKIIREVREAGEIPEFIFMEKVDCEYSGVINPDRVAFGKSNAGATGGENAVEIVLSIDKSSELQAKGNFWNSAEWPYAEMLYAKGEIEGWGRLVQLRSGPKLSGMEEKKVLVTEVKKVDSTMDLIEWDKGAELLKEKVVRLSEEDAKVKGYDEEAPVVWHSGGALSSHYGVHCKTGKVTLAYVTSEKAPKIGDVIEVGKVNPPDLKAVREGLLLGLNQNVEKGYGVIENRKRAVSDVKNFLGALHIYSIADMGDRNTARYIGYSWGVGMRVIGALPLGEARHKTAMRKQLGELIITRNWEKQNKGKKGSVIEKAKEKLAKELNGNFNGKGWELTISGVRDAVYHKAWELDIDILLEALLVCYDGFMPTGGMHWSSGYGGKKWGNCTISLLKCIAAMEEFVKDSSDGKLGEIVTELNVMINEAHNGVVEGQGSWLDKLLSTDVKKVMDSASILPQFLLSPKRAYEAKDNALGKFQEKELAFTVSGMLSDGRKKYGEEKVKVKTQAEKAALEYQEQLKNSSMFTVKEWSKPAAQTDNADDIWHVDDDLEGSNVDDDSEESESGLVINTDLIEKDLVELVNKAVNKVIEGKGKVVYGQYKSSGNNFHYQIACDQINRDYGYANSVYLSEKCGEKTEEHDYVGKKLGSLTGSKATYKPVTLYTVEEEMGGVKGIILGVLSGYDVKEVGDNLIWFLDHDLWKSFEKASGEKNKQWAVENIYNNQDQEKEVK